MCVCVCVCVCGGINKAKSTRVRSQEKTVGENKFDTSREKNKQDGESVKEIVHVDVESRSSHFFKNIFWNQNQRKSDSLFSHIRMSPICLSCTHAHTHARMTGAGQTGRRFMQAM